MVIRPLQASHLFLLTAHLLFPARPLFPDRDHHLPGNRLFPYRDSRKSANCHTRGRIRFLLAIPEAHSLLLACQLSSHQIQRVPPLSRTSSKFDLSCRQLIPRYLPNGSTPLRDRCPEWGRVPILPYLPPAWVLDKSILLRLPRAIP